MAGNDWFYRKGWLASNSPERCEIPSDPAFPFLARMLDASQMRGFLDRVLQMDNPGCTIRIEDCRVTSVAYRPGRECRVNYAVNFCDGVTEASRWRLIYAKTLSTKRAKRMLTPRLNEATDCGVSFLRLEDGQTILAGFPNDLRIHGLRQFLVSDRFREIANRALANRHLEAVNTSDALTIFSYRPERHCLFKCALRDTRSKGTRIIPAFARIYRDDRGADVFRVMQQLWQSEGRQTGALHVAEPLGYDPDERTLLQSAIEGKPFAEMAAGSDYLEIVAQTGRTLAAIHRCQVYTNHTHRKRISGEEIGWLEKNARGLTRVFPELGEQLHAISKLLQRALPCIAAQPYCLIHGDFSLNQILVGNDRLGIVDFDDAGLGNHHADVGTCLARMHSSLASDDDWQKASEAFRENYQSASQIHLAENQVNWFYACGLTRLGLSRMSHLQSGWKEKMSDCFDRAIASLSE